MALFIPAGRHMVQNSGTSPPRADEEFFVCLCRSPIKSATSATRQQTLYDSRMEQTPPLIDLTLDCFNDQGGVPGGVGPEFPRTATFIFQVTESLLLGTLTMTSLARVFDDPLLWLLMFFFQYSRHRDRDTVAASATYGSRSLLARPTRTAGQIQPGAPPATICLDVSEASKIIPP